VTSMKGLSALNNFSCSTDISSYNGTRGLKYVSKPPIMLNPTSALISKSTVMLALIQIVLDLVPGLSASIFVGNVVINF
jgi:hypothetical protein